MRKKKEVKKYGYHDLVNAAKNVIFTLVVSDKDGKVIRTQDGETIYMGLISYVHMYGGRPPKDLNELLTYDHLHQLRHSWCSILCKYFKPFLPGLTITAMWSIIKEQRKQYYKINTLRADRIKNRVNDVSYFTRYCSKRVSEVSHVKINDYNHSRIYPLHFDKYYNFIEKKYYSTYHSKDFWKVKYLDDEDRKGIFHKPEEIHYDDSSLYEQGFMKNGIPFSRLELGYSGSLYFLKGKVVYEE